MKEEKFVITYMKDGKIKTIEREETIEELKMRIEFYKNNNYEIVAIDREVIKIELQPITKKQIEEMLEGEK